MQKVGLAVCGFLVPSRAENLRVSSQQITTPNSDVDGNDFLNIFARYILGIESPLVCDIINTADEETGFMTLDTENLANLAKKDPPLIVPDPLNYKG